MSFFADLRQRVNNWFVQPRFRKAFAITRWLITFLLVSGGWAFINSEPTSGVGLVLATRAGDFTFRLYGALNIACGLLIAIIQRPNARQFAISISPVGLYLFLLILGWAVGLNSLGGGFWFILVLFVICCVVLYGFSEDSVIETALRYLKQIEEQGARDE